MTAKTATAEWTIMGAFFERREVDVTVAEMEAWKEGKLSDDDITALLRGPRSRQTMLDDWIDCDFWPLKDTETEQTT